MLVGPASVSQGLDLVLEPVDLMQQAEWKWMLAAVVEVEGFEVVGQD